MYCQRSICQQAGVPFRSKVGLAVSQIEHFVPVPQTQTHVLIDSWYHCKQVRKAAQWQGWAVSGALKRNQVMRLVSPDGSRHWLPLSDYAVRLTREDWETVVWPAAAGGQKLYAHRIETWVRKLGPTVVLITCHDPDEPLKTVRYWGSTLLELDAQSLVNTLAVRWEVETFFEYEKDLLGSDQYQVMTTTAILRFWTLIACLMCFLDEQRSSIPTAEATCGDARRMVQEEHRSNLLRWLEAQFRAGATVEQVRNQLALSSS